MADAALIFALLAGLVVVFVYLSWDIGWTFRSQRRAYELAGWRRRLPAHSAEWALFQAEVEARRLVLAEALEDPSAVARLAALADGSVVDVAAV